MGTVDDRAPGAEDLTIDERIDRLETEVTEMLEAVRVAEERVLRFEAQTETEERGQAVCGCLIGSSPNVSREFHDWLLSVEERGFGGCVEASLHFRLQDDLQDVQGELKWFDLPDFVAEHNWRNPIAMKTWARDVVSHNELGAERQRLRFAVAQIGVVLDEVGR